MKKIIAFAGSNSKNSINKRLVTYVVHKIQALESQVLDLNEFELPLYGIDYEQEYGIPKEAQHFMALIKSTDGIVLSLAEHNGNYSAAFKNIYDWMSRIDGKVWNNKPMFLMATSNGGRGGASVFEIAKNSFPRMGANIVAEFSLPFFNNNFSEKELLDEVLNNQLNQEITNFEKAIQ
jgi:NAD(P)H-dependent FMN reductase